MLSFLNNGSIPLPLLSLKSQAAADQDLRYSGHFFNDLACAGIDCKHTNVLHLIFFYRPLQNRYKMKIMEGIKFFLHHFSLSQKKTDTNFMVQQ